MTRTPLRRPRGILACALALLAASAPISCGSDSEGAEQPTQKISFERYTFETGPEISGPKKVKAGVTEITFKNNSSGKADLQLIRVEGDHTPAEVIDGLKKSTRGKPYPDWFFAGGGVGLTETGDTPSVIQVLKPGTYYLLNTETVLSPKRLTELQVTGKPSSEELPDEDETVEASEYAFKSEAPLEAGSRQILFDNAGAQPHHMLAAKLIGEATIEDVEKAFKSKGGKPPLLEKSLQTTAVVEGGEGQVVTWDLEPGRYAFFCFISDREGGPPHALKGMVDEIEVEPADG